MKRNMTLRLVLLAAVALLAGCKGMTGTESDKTQKAADEQLAREILSDPLMPKVDSLARVIVGSGLTAGDSYGEVWIRDFNTFIDLAMEVTPLQTIRQNLLTFFHFQGPEGDIPDGFIPVSEANLGYDFRYSETDPLHAAHKNTVETDQESSLIQAVCRYIRKTGDTAILDETVAGSTVRDRLAQAIDWLVQYRMVPEYGLLWGGTTADWGDVQPEHPWGVFLNEDSHPAIDIYDNAMFAIALTDFASVCRDPKPYLEQHRQIREAVRKYLWDSEKNKFHPHIYLDKGSPFPADLDEEAIYYNGGTAVAIQAGFLTEEEVKAVNEKLLENVAAAGAQSVGLTLYPCYPGSYFQNPIMADWSYQNGGDWTWFGARMIQGLTLSGVVREAYDELQPMLERVVKNNGFYEWYSVSGEPRGSGTYRGSAGELYLAMRELRTWATHVLEK